MKKKNIYFISDIHLGLPNHEKSLKREKLLVNLLDEIKSQTSIIYFVGDIFDFWWEYKYVAPRAYIRFLGKIAELTDSGIEIHFFTGNHDVWMKSYLQTEVGVKIHTKELITEIYGKKFFIAHGDGLGRGDRAYKFLKKIFQNKFLQWCWSRLHPDFAFSIAKIWSHSRRKKEKVYKFRGIDKEIMIQFSKEMIKTKHFDYFIFGHRHFPLMIKIGENSKHINIGDWLVNFTFVIFNSEGLKLMTYKNGYQEEFITDLNKLHSIDIF